MLVRENLEADLPKIIYIVLSFDRLGGLMLEVSVPVDKPPFIPTLPTMISMWIGER